MEELTSRSGMYRLLSRLWLREVDESMLRELGTSPMRDSFVEAGGQLPLTCDAETLEQLAVDYCQLFIGPSKHFPPIQSVWESGQFAGDSAASVKSFAEIAHYPTDAMPPGMMLDHLGIQLDIMGHILAQVASNQPEEELHIAGLELARTFLTTHLTWTTNLFTQSEKRATTEFYRSVISMTAAFLISELAFVGAIEL